MKFFCTPLIAITVLLISFKMNAEIQIRDNRIPGGIAVLKIKADLEKPVAFFEKVPSSMQYMEDKTWAILVPLPIDSPIGEAYVQITAENTVFKIPFEIRPHQYPSEKIQIQNHALVQPPESLSDQLADERKQVRKTLQTPYLPNEDFTGFDWPVKGRITSEYGTTRIYNGIPKSPHKGIDIAAPKGTEIKAADDGLVVFSGNLYYNGLTVIIAHSKSLKTIYSHLSKITVKENESVSNDTVIGLVGSTGRSTGPHLHWGVYFNSVALDPHNFLQQR